MQMDRDSRDGLVGLVLVSHSAAIADGLAQLVAQVAGPRVPIVAVGLMDLGSAVLSVRAALGELPEETVARLRIADAPLVEGAIAAGVTASTGGSVDEVLAAAEEARTVGKL